MNEILEVKVTQAQRKTFWYAKHIGKTFIVEESQQWKGEYELVLPGETLRSFIKIEDADKVSD